MADPDPTTEEWRPVEGWPYSISNLGRLRRDVTITSTTAGRILRPGLDVYGYARTALGSSGKRRYVMIHALVAVAFIGPRPPGHTVNHKNAVKTDNRAENLEWATPAQQKRHAMLHGLVAVGTRNRHAKLLPEQVIEMRAKHALGRTGASLGREYGLDKATVCAIVKRQLWKHI